MIYHLYSQRCFPMNLGDLTIYINDLPRVSPLFNMVMYADDTTLYCNLSNNTNKKNLNSELHKISEWLASNKLSLNAQKNKFMFFHSMQKKVKYPALTLNNTIMQKGPISRC